jgi:type VI secretion system protein VasG
LKDPALTRRFQTVQVHEPDEVKAILMLRSTVSPLETHHQVLLLDEAVSAAVKLSHRYIPARQLPDKAVALLDTACARVAVSQSAPPAQLEDCLRHLAALDVEIEIAGREARVGAGEQRVAALTAERTRMKQNAKPWPDAGKRNAAWCRRLSACAPRCLRG